MTAEHEGNKRLQTAIFQATLFTKGVQGGKILTQRQHGAAQT
jgi:hypothetical protein